MRQAILHCKSLVQCCTSRDPVPRADKVHLTSRYKCARKHVCTLCNPKNAAPEKPVQRCQLSCIRKAFSGERPLRHDKISSIAVHKKARSGITLAGESIERFSNKVERQPSELCASSCRPALGYRPPEAIGVLSPSLPYRLHAGFARAC
jgi:hypothetical protein